MIKLILLIISGCNTTSNNKNDLNKKYVPSLIQLYKLNYLLFESTIYGRKWIFNGKTEKAEFKDKLKTIRYDEIPIILEKIDKDLIEALKAKNQAAPSKKQARASTV